MNRIIYSLLFMLLSSLNDNDLKYYTYERWSLPEEFENSYLKDNPKEVKDTYYVDKSDSSLSISGKLNNYDIWKFDNDGDKTFHKYSSNSDSFWIITKYEFTSEGLQSINYANSVSNKKEDTIKIVTEKKVTNFLETHIGLDKPEYSMISFLNKGNTRKQEFIADTNSLSDILRTQIYYYNNNGMVQKKELITNDGYHKMENFFYSKENFLDSIYIYDNEKVTSKEIFFNNQFGDPVKYLALDSLNDTTKIAYIKYKYDQHNNWVRQLVKEEDKSIYAKMFHILKSDYTLSVREIKY